MWPTLRDSIKNFFTDRAFFATVWDRWVTKVRTLIMVGGAYFAIYGDKIEASAPQFLQGRVKFIGILLMGASLYLRAGDKTPPELMEAAKQMRAASQVQP